MHFECCYWGEKTHNAYIFQSKKCTPRVPHVCGRSGVASPRSLLILSLMNRASDAEMKPPSPAALSGKSTIINHAPSASNCVRRPSMIFVQIRAALVQRHSPLTHKDPPPTPEGTHADLHQSICEDIGESAGQNGKEIEDCEPEGWPLAFAG